ncbi:hypothetical protein G6F63_016800 [Rhizopus arrhizus]|nr:hypothetical protein G6F32_017116 [Rhizopus arrhizus]KAG1301557.1 hypothetical protein G6F63_016800 [Rhizopus arrhizus]
MPVPGQLVGPARLGPCAGLRRNAVADAAAGDARGLRHRHRDAIQRARIHQYGGARTGHPAGVGRRRAGGDGHRAVLASP